jgi:DNA-binding NarL/FixJ family response regulator
MKERGLSPELTRQEARVASAVADGMTNREIAARLSLSAKTVEFHLSNVYAKLGVRSRTELAILLVPKT